MRVRAGGDVVSVQADRGYEKESVGSRSRDSAAPYGLEHVEMRMHVRETTSSWQRRAA